MFIQYDGPFFLNTMRTFYQSTDLIHIFDRFYKTSTVSDRRGFGLGLSISKKIVENHKGRIKVDYSRNKKEITFKVFLPLFKEK